MDKKSDGWKWVSVSIEAKIPIVLEKEILVRVPMNASADEIALLARNEAGCEDSPFGLLDMFDIVEASFDNCVCDADEDLYRVDVFDVEPGDVGELPTFMVDRDEDGQLLVREDV